MKDPITTINQYLEEVRRLDRVAPTEPWEFFQGAFCCGKPEARQIMFVPKPTTSKEVVEFIEMTRTAAPRLAEAVAYVMKVLRCLRLEVPAVIIDDIELNIARILSQAPEGPGEESK